MQISNKLSYESEIELSYEKPFGIYIHIPFCANKCRYCDFYSCRYKKSLVEKYFEALFIELENMLSSVQKKLIRSVYFGGGTPSLISSEYIFKILKKIKKNFNYPPNMEITLEANPDSLSQKRLVNYRQVGINRLSLGVQSFDDNILKFLGRKSSSKKNKIKIELVKKYFNNYSLDIIFAVPGQTMDDFCCDLNTAISFSPTHLSLYNLQIEEGTEIYNDLVKGKIKKFDQELDASMYKKAVSLLKDCGYKHYEISNFAKNGYRAIHNYLYWDFTPYLALGPSASGFDGKTRYTNTADLNDYIDMIFKSGFPEREYTVLSLKDLAAEYSFLNLRKKSGLSRLLFKKQFYINFDDLYKEEIKKLMKLELIYEQNGRIFLSERGKLLGNEVFAHFLP
ncbi:oxygen-independent coproporphyrinogen-3 oxidase [Halanaerobium sp. DL-01]|uniref:radical SAM family heme chaperone HemW n=1 Tax=Halanaerobium sp. DL-01 TaxID=1653064 RepID=UPI000DF2D171|nr:radical SAM family heme chaperone HemW [Halanaerobium sp. DL-01]RCW82582.1 oxygen-independent coproporphyrinogen-3 oxidase [Halanaerobium sp. DL-01]